MSDTSPDDLVYIAYARADIARVEPIVAALREHGFAVVFATAAHGIGNDVHESQRALRLASALVVFISARSTRSAWVEAETRAYQSLLAQRPRRALIPIRLDDTPLPVSLTSYTSVNGVGAEPALIADTLGYLLALAHIRRIAAPAVSDAEEADDVAAALDASFGRAADGPQVLHDGVAINVDWDAVRKGISDSEFPDDTADDAQDGAPFESAPPAPAPKPEWAPPIAPAAAPPAAPPPFEPGSPPYAPPQPAPTSGALGPSPTWTRTATETADAVGLEQVTFTAYHPRETQPRQWQPMVVYLSLDSPSAMAQVASYAAERLAGKLDQYRPARASKAAGLRRGAELRIIPSAPGVQFNPSYLDVTWQEDVQQHEFRMCAVSAQPGQAVNGVVQFYQGLVLRAEIPISIFVGQAVARLDSPEAFQQAIARAYRRIFASYSHQDMPVVESCESAARSMGDQYLRDVSLLQSGQQWDPRLIQAINDADIFQLFWSKRAATSPFVEREWRHALMLLPTRPNFIRPVYWNRQLYPTPPELTKLHFQPLSLSSLGWSQLRMTWYELRNR
ncbi:MAG TPA: toll/interleukin-1 receptor domain-containing protein [Ktedonobacterales bacterium]|jgi:hypothetical protein|nr:toll/interleukin-1 receptor domain-containing protein [Ktedonobacterales bacterium]